MREPPDLLAATSRMDFAAIRAYLDVDPECIHQTDAHENNAMHLCVAGGSFRVVEIMRFFLDASAINLLHENRDGRNPLELAIAINDENAIDLLEEPTHRQLTALTPDAGPNIKPVP
jgi:ankyrin repeat protein